MISCGICRQICSCVSVNIFLLFFLLFRRLSWLFNSCVSRSGSVHSRNISSRIFILDLPLLLCNFFGSFLYSFSHYFHILPGQIPSLVKFQPVFYLLLQFGTKNTGAFITESINPAGNTALVREVPTDPPLVLGSSTANEAAVENQAVLGSVTTCLQSSEKSLLSPQYLNCTGWGLGQVSQTA